jgi:hypothetical protein
LSRLSAPGSIFAGLVDEVAAEYAVDPRALTVRTLLHLPRSADQYGRLSRDLVMAELSRTAAQLWADTQATGGLMAHGPHLLRDLEFERLSTDQAEPIFKRLHYLRSARPGSTNYALVDPVHRLPVTLCSVSPLDWRRVGNHIAKQFGVPSTRIWDVSRVYSSDLAPANAISYLFAHVRRALRADGAQVDLLTTAVDPNLGFTGASYRAANWQHWLSVGARPYLYQDGEYVTPRQLRTRFGNANLHELGDQPYRFEQSSAPLRDSFIYCWRLHGQTELVDPADRRRLHRWSRPGEAGGSS